MHGSPRNQSLDDDNICIACEDTELGSHWIQCTNDDCCFWWHTICAGLGECLSKKQIHFCQTCP